MILRVNLGSRRFFDLGKKLGTGNRTIVADIGHKWVKMTCPFTLRSETIKRAVWDEAVAPTAKPTTINLRKIRAANLRDIEAKCASYRLSLEAAAKPLPQNEIEKAITTYRKGQKKILRRVVEAATTD